MYTNKTHLNTNKISKHSCAVIGQVVEQTYILCHWFLIGKFFLAEKVLLNQKFLFVHSVFLNGKLKFCYVVPSPNWIELLVSSQNQDNTKPPFCAVLNSLVGHVTQVVFSPGAIPQQRWSNLKTQAIRSTGKLNSQSNYGKELKDHWRI